jgi:hypothetical protein
LIGLLANERNGGDDAEDVALEWEPRLRKGGGLGQAGEMSDRRCALTEETSPVLERLHRPALEAAGELGRGVGPVLGRRRCSSNREGSEHR